MSDSDKDSVKSLNKTKCVLLKLSGQALATISELSLSSENYKEAAEIFTSRYGNTQVLVSAHMDSLLKNY